MKFLDLINLLLQNANKLPQIVEAIQKLVADLSALVELITGKPLAAEPAAVSAFSVEEQTAVADLQSVCDAQGLLGGGALLKLLPLLQMLAPVLLPLLEKLLAQKPDAT